MTSTSDRRLQGAAATVIDHAIALKKSHGSAFASSYLRNQGIHEDTIQRVLFGHWGDHRVQDCRSSSHKG